MATGIAGRGDQRPERVRHAGDVDALAAGQHGHLRGTQDAVRCEAVDDHGPVDRRAWGHAQDHASPDHGSAAGTSARAATTALRLAIASDPPLPRRLTVAAAVPKRAAAAASVPRSSASRKPRRRRHRLRPTRAPGPPARAPRVAGGVAHRPRRSEPSAPRLIATRPGPEAWASSIARPRSCVSKIRRASFYVAEEHVRCAERIGDVREPWGRRVHEGELRVDAGSDARGARGPERIREAAPPHVREVQQAAGVQQVKGGAVGQEVRQRVRPRLEAGHAHGQRALGATEQQHVDADRRGARRGRGVAHPDSAFPEDLTDVGAERVIAGRGAQLHLASQPGEGLHRVPHGAGHQQLHVRRADPLVERRAVERRRAPQEQVHVDRADRDDPGRGPGVHDLSGCRAGTACATPGRAWGRWSAACPG